MASLSYHADRRGSLAAHLPHHRTCGSASGGSMKNRLTRSASCTTKQGRSPTHRKCSRLSFTIQPQWQRVDLSWRASGRQYKSERAEWLGMTGPAPKAAELRRAFERDLSEVDGTHVYVDAITKSIPADLLESALQACWDFLARFPENEGGRFSVRIRSRGCGQAGKSAKSHGIKLADCVIFNACDTLVHGKC